MSTTEQEMNEALDALEAESGEAFDQEEIAPEEVVIEARDEEIVEDAPKDKPPGYLSYEEWVEKGKDPADFRGENAYKAQYDALKEVRELKDTMTHVVEGMDTWKQQQAEVMAQQVEQAKVDAQAELDQAVEEDDTAAAISAKDKLHKLDKQPVQTQVNPVISDFAKKNPIIDTNNAQYNAEFHQDMIMIHNGKLDQLLGGDRSRANELTQAQIERVQALAFSQAKELHQDKFVSSKNKRTTAPASKQRPVKSAANHSVRLKDVGGNSKNPRDTSPANDLYDIIKAKDPKLAETFAKNVTGE